jgi:hypothetical protein
VRRVMSQASGVRRQADRQGWGFGEDAYDSDRKRLEDELGRERRDRCEREPVLVVRRTVLVVVAVKHGGGDVGVHLVIVRAMRFKMERDERNRQPRGRGGTEDQNRDPLPPRLSHAGQVSMLRQERSTDGVFRRS